MISTLFFQMTVEQRLSAISLEKPQGSGAKQPPKADTLVTLLVQGLQSQDRKLLNVSTPCTDEHITYFYIPEPILVCMLRFEPRRW